MAIRGETSWRPCRQCPPLRHQRPACISGSPESEARGLHGAGRQDPERTLLHSNQQRPRAPSGLYSTPLCFNTVQKESHVPLGRGAGNSGLQRLGAQPPSRWGDPGCQQQGQVAPRMAQCVAQGQDLPPRRCHELSVGGAAQGPEAKMVQRRKAEPRSLLPSHASSASSASTTFTASRAEPRAEQTPWPPSKGRRGRVSEGPRSTTDGMGGLPHTREEDSLTPRRRTPSHPGGLPHTREDSHTPGRTPSHPGGEVLRATAVERVSETGEDHSGL